MYKNSAIFLLFFIYFFSLLFCNDPHLKTRWSGTLIQAENVAINSDIVGSFTFGKSFEEILGSFLSQIFCTSGAGAKDSEGAKSIGPRMGLAQADNFGLKLTNYCEIGNFCEI